MPRSVKPTQVEAFFDRDDIMVSPSFVRPLFGNGRKIVGFHSNRRVPDRKVLKSTVIPLDAQLLREEKSHPNGKDAVAAGCRGLDAFVRARKTPYEQFVFSL